MRTAFLSGCEGGVEGGEVGHRWSHGRKREMQLGSVRLAGWRSSRGQQVVVVVVVRDKTWGNSFRVLLLLSVQLPLATTHRSDEGGTLTAAVLGQQEGDVTFGGEVLHRLLEDPRETGKRWEGDRKLWSGGTDKQRLQLSSEGWAASGENRNCTQYWVNYSTKVWFFNTTHPIIMASWKGVI